MRSSRTTGGDFPVESGRYHLYVARACPWAHRTLIGRALMGLQDAISVSFVDPIRDERGWRFSGDGYVDPINGFRFLSEAYLKSEPDYAARVTVPVLWDTAIRDDRQQRVSRHPADAVDGVRARWPSTRSSSCPSGCVARSRRSTS